ncbi:MAG: hypothetical protein GY811_07405 [Myxococcales bacterium]|nr:hypothetical protein [Myxococcales bacterium]
MANRKDVWAQGASVQRELDKAEKALDRATKAYEAETAELRAQIREHKQALAKLAKGVLGATEAPKARVRTTSKPGGKTRKKRTPLDWEQACRDFMAVLEPGMGRKQWTEAVEERSKREYSYAHVGTVLEILRGHGTGKRAIKAQIGQSGKRSKTTYKPLRAANTDRVLKATE